MFRKVLFPTDFSIYAEKTTDYVIGLKATGIEEVVQVFVLEPGEEYPVTMARKERTMKTLLEREELFRKQGLKVKSRVELGEPYREILRTAKDEEVSMIVIGCHGKGLLDEVLVGSVSDRVTREADIPVLLVKFKVLHEETGPKVEEMSADLFKKVLYPTDNSPCSQTVTGYVRELKKVGCEQVFVANVIDPSTVKPRDIPIAVSEMEKKLAVEKNILIEQGMKATVAVPVGRPVDEILRIARGEDVSLIVMGSTGKGYFKQMLLGSVSENVVRHAKCPVLIIHNEVCMMPQATDSPS